MQSVIFYVQIFNEIIRQFGCSTAQELALAWTANQAVYDGYFQNEIRVNVLSIYGNSPESIATYNKISQDIYYVAPVALTREQLTAKTKAELFDILLALDPTTTLKVTALESVLIDEILRLSALK